MKFRRIGKITYAVIGVYLFVLGLRTITTGAENAAIQDLLAGIGVDGILGCLGFGWLMACLVMSGSPVAAAALALHAGDVLDPLETFAMITGSRLGASFVVLLIGVLYDLKGKRPQKSVYVGAVALLVTITTYVPAMLLGLGLLKLGWFEGISLSWPGKLIQVLDPAFVPVIGVIRKVISGWGLFPAGVGILLLAFKIFDLALPNVDPFRGNVERMATVVYRPPFAFLMGMLVTCLTLSVSVSVTILVPLTARGYVRRENLIPYILGANITTWIDTFFASLIIEDTPSAFMIVLVLFVSGGIFSLAIILLAYGKYELIIDRWATRATMDWRMLSFFVVFFLAVPLIVLLF